jgi:integrase
MSAVRYQKGSVENSGNWYYVRFRMKVPGHKKPKKMRERVCPVKGPGLLNEQRRLVKAQQIVDASGVNDGYLESQSSNPRAAVTFQEQGFAMLREIAKRKRKPVAPSTLMTWECSLHNWLYPALGQLPLSEVNNKTVRPLIATMAKTLKPATIQSHLMLIKRVVASAVDGEGEQLYLRKWNHEFLDVPIIVQREVNSPCFSSEIVSALTQWKNPRARTIFILCAASGLRIGEALGLDLSKHFSEDFRTIRIEQKAIKGVIEERLKTESSYREIDLDPRVATVIKEFAAGRTSGLLFCTRTGRPLGVGSILTWHLYLALEKLGYVNPITGNHRAGTHAFRRFRETHLGKCEGLPRGIRLFWMGHAEENMTDHYDKIREDRVYRREWAVRCGIGFELPVVGRIVPITSAARPDENAA